MSKKAPKKLGLGKESLRTLSQEAMDEVVGGTSSSMYTASRSACTNCLIIVKI